jgi:hypothetical protein
VEESIKKEILDEIKEIKTLLRRLVYLFEQYDADVFEDEEIKRELQGSKKNGWRG